MTFPGAAGAGPTATAWVVPGTGCPAEAGGSGSFSEFFCGVGRTFSVGCSLQLQNSLTPPAVWAAQAALAREVGLCGERWGGLPGAAGNTAG